MTPWAYYNEHDPFCAAWLRELIAADAIAPGVVDERSIEAVSADDVREYRQCHWFAGIGGWSYACRLAGWSDTRAIWTGSCPCQPFAMAGAQAGADDSRDLWPTWRVIIGQCRPTTIVGEQVEAAITRGWFDRLADDLESYGYAVGTAILPAACVGAFHRRNRVWFVADRDGNGQSVERPASVPRQSETRHDTNRRGAIDYTDAGRHHIEWRQCRDGRRRPTPADICPVVDGVPGDDVAILRAVGNAIVPQVAAAFVRAYCDARGLDR